MYADSITQSMDEAIKETERRRKIQLAYNKEHHIVPKTIKKDIRELISNVDETKLSKKKKYDKIDTKMLDKIEEEMKEAAKNLDFERAMELRDILFELKTK